MAVEGAVSFKPVAGSSKPPPDMEAVEAVATED
jgi:hypothetical protein